MPGCNDPAACNFDPSADSNDGSCTYPGCTDPTACNYNPVYGCDDGSCQYGDQVINFFINQTDVGSTVTLSVFDSEGGVLIDQYTSFIFGSAFHQSCTFSDCAWLEVTGLSGPNGFVQAILVGQDIQPIIITSSGDLCIIPGCMDVNACNYNPDATSDDSSCEYASCQCATDFDGNGTVNTSDLLLFMASFGCTFDCGAFDLDSNGVVNTSDLLLMMASFGEECG